MREIESANRLSEFPNQLNLKEQLNIYQKIVRWRYGNHNFKKG